VAGGFNHIAEFHIRARCRIQRIPKRAMPIPRSPERSRRYDSPERARCVLVLENNSSGAILAPGVGASQFRRAIAGIPEIYWKGLAREVGRSSDLAVIKFLFIDRK